MLTTSTYLAGCQCPRRLWQRSFTPELAADDAGGDDAWRAVDAEIGRRARALFRGGVLVDEAATHDDAVELTRALVADPSVGAIFAGAFVHDGVRVRVDVLERLTDGRWGLRQVRTGLGVRDDHLHGAAVQRFVLEGSGIRTPSVEIVHLARTYVRGGGDVDWPRLFARTDVSTEVACILAGVPARVAALGRVLALDAPPIVEPGEHCFGRHACEFWAHCTREKRADWVHRLRGRPFATLRAAGIANVGDIPDDFELSPVQRRIRDALQRNAEAVGPELAAALAACGPPAVYMDFETTNPAIPLYPGTSPYQRVPFQWSLHELDAAGVLRHREFLADARRDPRREFAERLLAALADGREPVVVYSDFEAAVLRELAAAFPDLAPRLDALGARLVDLLPVVRDHVYHPAFGGSFSLKRVVPALVEGFGYADLADVADGGSASSAILRLASGADLDTAEEARLRRALLAYCARDTLALVELHRALRARAVAARPVS